MMSGIAGKNTPMGVPDSDDDSKGSLVELVDILILLFRRKKLIIGLPLLVGIIAGAISFVLPNVYKASTRLLPPQQSQSSAAALLSQLGGVAGAVAGSAGLKNPNDLYVGMLKSRTIADRLIAQYNLKTVYGTDSQDKARKRLEDNTTILAGKDGLISIDVEDENPKMVAKIANSYVTELVSLTKTVAVTEASKRRIFFEHELETSKNNLANAEVMLKRSLDANGVVSVDTESRVMMETVGRLRAQISAKQIQLNSMRAFLTESHPEYKRIEQELNSQRAELAKLENGQNDGAAVDGTAGKPAGLENIKILRDVKYNQMLYELLAKQYEAARLDEAKDPAIVQVLDPAIDPERKFKPKRLIIILLSTFAALVVAVGWSLMLDAKEKLMRIPGGKEQLDKLSFSIRKW